MVLASSTTVSSTGRELLDQFAGHSAALALQFLLTQGLAAVLLGTVLVGWCSVATAADRTRIGRAGGAAVAVSLVQCVLGLLIAWIAVPAGDPEVVGAWVAILNRLDGAKMLLLAIALGCVARGRGVSRPAWLALLCGSAASALLVSAVGYGFQLDVPATAAFVSLPLLLASVAAGAFAVAPVTTVDVDPMRGDDPSGGVRVNRAGERLRSLGGRAHASRR
jgi:hypothetical protein